MVSEQELPPDRLMPEEIALVRKHQPKLEAFFEHLKFAAWFGWIVKHAFFWFGGTLLAIYGIRHIFPWFADWLIYIMKGVPQ